MVHGNITSSERPSFFVVEDILYCSANEKKDTFGGRKDNSWRETGSEST